MGALPKAMAKRGHRVMVVAPRYSNYENVNNTGVRHRINMFGSQHEVGWHAFDIRSASYI